MSIFTRFHIDYGVMRVAIEHGQRYEKVLISKRFIMD